MTRRGVIHRAADVFASFGFASVLLVLLFLLTLFGTLEQVDHGLYEVQKKYFESFFLVHYLGPVPLPLPGATLVMSLLALNLLTGGLIRIRKSKATVGVIVIHIGVVVMLAAGLVKLTLSDDGHLTLYETQRSDEYVSYYLWEIAIFDAAEATDVRELIVPGADFMDLGAGRSASFHSPELPFRLTLSHFLKNCRALPKGPMWEGDSPVVEGYALKRLPLDGTAERNIAGIHVRAETPDGASAEGILWGLEQYPWTFAAGGKVWGITLRHKHFKMPFTIELDDFTRVLHPRTGIPKSFMSDVTKVEDGERQPLRISMNEPLRHGGLVLFQSSWGPSDAGPNDPLFSTFSVVRNPSDYWPLYSCIIIGVGLLIAFGQKLARYVKSQSARRQRADIGGQA